METEVGLNRVFHLRVSGDCYEACDFLERVSFVLRLRVRATLVAVRQCSTVSDKQDLL